MRSHRRISSCTVKFFNWGVLCFAKELTKSLRSICAEQFSFLCFKLCCSEAFVKNTPLRLPLASLKSTRESLGNKEWKDQCCFCVNLHWLGITSDFTPTNCLVRSCATVRTIE